MSKISVAVLAIVLGAASVSFAVEPAPPVRGPSVYDTYSGYVPSGMRFGDLPQTATIRAEGGQLVAGDPTPYGYGGYGGGCGGCGGLLCLDWKLVSWYASWNDGHHGHGYGNGYGYGAGCANGNCNGY
jgi:hypothetical protein